MPMRELHRSVTRRFFPLLSKAILASFVLCLSCRHGEGTVDQHGGAGSEGGTASYPDEQSVGGTGGQPHVGAGGSGGTDPKGTGGGESGPKATDFMLGVDISSVPEAIDQGTSYFDTDGTQKPILDLLSDHGFNYVRLRTFVEPMAQYGYAHGDGGSCIKSEAYCDLAHTLEFGKQIKEANMGLLIDFHYSDNWADPGKQIIPEAWRDAATIEELAGLLKSYTKDAISTLVDGGARPDVVQIGNEITPGMLVHVPTDDTDCWGNGSVRTELNGSVGNWDNLATLLRAGIEGVHEVDPSIRTMIHLENTDYTAGAVSWVRSAHERGVQFDILGMSCYPAYQGPPSGWESTFATLAATFPDLSFVVAEYGPEPRAVIDVVTGIEDERGIGAFRWEPTQSGAWGPGMFTFGGAGQHANADDFRIYDELKVQVGL